MNTLKFFLMICLCGIHAWGITPVYSCSLVARNTPITVTPELIEQFETVIKTIPRDEKNETRDLKWLTQQFVFVKNGVSYQFCTREEGVVINLNGNYYMPDQQSALGLFVGVMSRGIPLIFENPYGIYPLESFHSAILASSSICIVYNEVLEKKGNQTIVQEKSVAFSNEDFLRAKQILLTVHEKKNSKFDPLMRGPRLILKDSAGLVLADVMLSSLLVNYTRLKDPDIAFWDIERSNQEVLEAVSEKYLPEPLTSYFPYPAYPYKVIATQYHGGREFKKKTVVLTQKMKEILAEVMAQKKSYQKPCEGVSFLAFEVSENDRTISVSVFKDYTDGKYHFLVQDGSNNYELDEMDFENLLEVLFETT